MHRIIFLIMIVLHCVASGLQTKYLHGDNRLMADVSLESINRIYVIDDRIAQVFSLNEDVAIETDAVTGQVFLRTKQNKPIDLNIITEKQVTLDLHLIPKKIPGETIIIKTHKLTESHKIQAKTTIYLDQITSLMLAMANNKTTTGYLVNAVNKEILLWDNIPLLQTTEHLGTNLIGEIYSLTNNTPERIFLTETQLAWQKGIAAVAIQKYSLAPNEQTQVYIVRHTNEPSRKN